MEKKSSSYLPDCWDDDERMGYLFSGFRANRQVNPRDWDNKLKFWTELVVKVGRTEHQFIFSVDSLLTKFERKGVLPQCIDGVVKEMHRNGQLIRVDDLKADSAWLSWGVNTFIRRPLRWTMTSVFPRGDASSQVEYVSAELLKECSAAFLERHHQSVQCASTDHVVDYATFREACADLCRDQSSFDLVLLHLQRKKDILVTTNEGTKIIKFASKGEKAVTPVTAAELGTLALKKTIDTMQRTIERLTANIQQQDKETKQLLHKGMKSSAKTALRRKKLCQKRLENTETTLDTLQQLQDRLQSSESEKMIMDAFKTGAQALRKTLDDNGLTPEAMDETISDVQEVMEMCNELDDTLAQGNKAIDETVNFGANVDVDDLDSELEALLRGDGELSTTLQGPTEGDAHTSGERDILSELPKVPTHKPASPQTSEQDASIRRVQLAL
ncbi:charged multivesicular body protein 7-like [Diadema setosum]|uniref:charged multivesicular body protein 7-like n=1 Tax=Diadema setosum TaxID=31175 RepID=UPI003B3B6C03